MWYRYDDYGWYAGDIIGTDTSRATQIEPPSLSISSEVGANRANFSNGQWSLIPFEVPEYTAEDLTPSKAEKIKQLFNDMTIAQYMPIEFMGDSYPADDQARADITALLAIGILPDGFFWFDVNKNPISINDIEYMRGLAGAIATRKMVYYATYVYKQGLIEAATTQAEIDAVTWQ